MDKILDKIEKINIIAINLKSIAHILELLEEEETFSKQDRLFLYDILSNCTKNMCHKINILEDKVLRMQVKFTNYTKL